MINLWKAVRRGLDNRRFENRDSTSERLGIVKRTSGTGECGLRRGGRVVEGARLESVYAGNRIAGSNPAPSANFSVSD
jgi:hypothetical protein